MKLLVEPYGYQKEGIRFAKSSSYSINGFTMGLGKTLVGIGLACEVAAKRPLVVCPAFLKINWESEIKKFCSDPSRFTVVSYGQVGKIDFSKHDVVIGDEAHYLKSLKAKRTQSFLAGIEKGSPDYVILLTGTPVKNRVPEFFPLMLLCHLSGRYPQFRPYANFWDFQSTFTQKKIVHYRSRKVTKFEGVKNVSRLKELLKPIYLRKRAEDVLDLPETVHREILLAEKSEADKAIEESWEVYEGGRQGNFAALKAVSALSKAAKTAEFVGEGLMAGDFDRVLVFTDHVQACESIAAPFGSAVAKFVTGATPMEARAEYVEALNEGRIKVLVATIGALSVGVNITGAHHVVFNDFAWVEADMDQARKRVHRIGQTKTCYYYYMLASKVDRLVFRTLRKKKALIAELDK